MKLSLSYLDAKALHKSFFTGDFQICKNGKSGYEGCFATDGERFVITKEGLIDAGKITKAFNFLKSDIESIEHSRFMTYIVLKKDIPGLTRPTWMYDFYIISFLLFTCGLGFPIVFFWGKIRKRRLKVVIERPLFGGFEHPPKDYQKNFDELINSIKI